ncbi:hypothetical protein SKAU_G00086980 [Synaphobranchus kaupii]|uniref:Uncharacterized protein n=1 Tax=Synaphobranchus kaupii TaxID=118154 RepID=A0A9Q1J3V6_SYNKA|nr:hypothetical protein SKAU_G00086980 [Synaphobranchus kaupii]
MKTESVMESTDYTQEHLRSSLNRSEEMEETIQKKTGDGMSREEKDRLSNMKEEEEEESGEWQIVKIEGEDGVKVEEGLWKGQGERDELRERDVTGQSAQNNREEGKKQFGAKLICKQQEGEELSALDTSFMLKQPRVLIRRLEIADISGHVSSPCSGSSRRGQVVRSPWKQQAVLPVRRKRQKIQFMNQKRKTAGQLDTPSENGICAEAPCSSPVISAMNQNTGQTVEVSSQVFAWSQFPFIHTEEVNLHQHIEVVQPEEHRRILRVSVGQVICGYTNRFIQVSVARNVGRVSLTQVT